MYENWTIRRWDTPASDVVALGMVSLVDDGTLAITLEDMRHPERSRWRFTFDRAPAYRNILEEYRLELWSHLDNSKQRCGSTFVVVDSPWLAEFRAREALMLMHYPDLQHFVIGTEDDVIEVLSPMPAAIEHLGPAPAGAPAAGKSMHYYLPADRDAVEEMIRKARDGADPD